MPLIMYPPGKPALIKKIGAQGETRRFLNSLGFLPGECVTVISEMGGNMIVNIKGTRIALDKSLAQKIVV